MIPTLNGSSVQIDLKKKIAPAVLNALQGIIIIMTASKLTQNSDYPRS